MTVSHQSVSMSSLGSPLVSHSHKRLTAYVLLMSAEYEDSVLSDHKQHSPQSLFIENLLPMLSG